MCECERFNWVFNQGVMLSVPIRYSRQGSPAGCFWTTTPSKREIMIPHSNSKKINNVTPLSLSLSITPSLSPSSTSLLQVRSMMWENEKKKNWEEGESRYESVSCHMTGKTRESNMSSKPIWFSAVSSGLPHVTNHFQRPSDTHTYTAEHVTHCGEGTTTVIVFFFFFRVHHNNLWCTHFIPHVKRHYSCCFPLIASSFFHVIWRQRIQKYISRLQSHLFWCHYAE